MDIADSIKSKFNTKYFLPLKVYSDDELFKYTQNQDPVYIDDPELVEKVTRDHVLILKDRYYDEDITLINFIAKTGDEELLNNIMSIWFPGSEIELTRDVKYNLLHFINYTQTTKFLLNLEERAYIVTLNERQLLGLLGKNYIDFIMPTDKSCTLFALISGIYVEYNYRKYNSRERYDEVASYDMWTTYVLDRYVLKTYHPNKQWLSMYMRVSNINKKLIEKTYLRVSYDNIADFVELHEMIIDNMTLEDQLKNLMITFIDSLSDYEEVLLRDEDFEPMSPKEVYLRLQTEAPNSIVRMLLQSTNRQLYSTFYAPNLLYIDKRHDLINTIYINLTDIDWRLNHHNFCTNDENFNILTLTIRSVENLALDPDDPILSYGSYYYYKCYKLSELQGSFRIEDDEYIFTNPDYNPNDPNSKPEFDIIVIGKLIKFLNDTGTGDEEFIQFLTDGYTDKTTPKTHIDLMNKQIDKYHSFDVNTRNKIIKFMVWLFLYSMYMRFWKGPGHPYPLININREGKYGLCDPEIRDENIFIQQGVYNIMNMTWSDIIKKWIDSMYVVTYDSVNNLFTVENRSLSKILSEVKATTYCMGTAADELMATSYYYLKLMVEYDINVIIENFIDKMLNYDKDVINLILKDISQYKSISKEDKKDKEEKIANLRSELKRVEKSINNGVNQPLFTIKGIAYNVHTD